MGCGASAGQVQLDHAYTLPTAGHGQLDHSYTLPQGSWDAKASSSAGTSSVSDAKASWKPSSILDSRSSQQPAGPTCRNGHQLEALGISRDNGWKCDGRNNPGGCASGTTGGVAQTQGMNRFRCTPCDFDLCEACWKKEASKVAAQKKVSDKREMPASKTMKTMDLTDVPQPALRKTCQRGHELWALGLTRDNGWWCDGRACPGGCKSGLNSYGQSAGINRFRCDSCDYDLCEKCWAAAPEVESTPSAATLRRTRAVVSMETWPKHWDMDAMNEVEMARGLNPDEKNAMNLFARVPLDMEDIRDLQDLFNASYRKVYTRDRRGGAVPDHLELTHGYRVQNAQNWIEFLRRQEAIRSHLEKLHGEGSPGVCPRGHGLKPLGTTRDNGWVCDGRSEGGCESGITDRNQTSGMNRFRCFECDYDLCEKCYLMRTGQKLCNAGHVLVPLGISRDNGWNCDGRAHRGGCKRGIVRGGEQSKGVNRFRCEECNWDLCDRCHAAHIGHVNTGVSELKTAGRLHRQEYVLDSQVNSVWLFHGTNDVAAESITVGDFLVDKAGSNAGTLYGRGIYLAESCSKSDEYTQENGEGLRCMLLCRAILGNVLYNCEARPNVDRLVKLCVRGTFHSVLGDREKLRGTYREFIVYDDDQVYPEFVIWYRRVYK